MTGHESLPAYDYGICGHPAAEGRSWTQSVGHVAGPAPAGGLPDRRSHVAVHSNV